VPEPRRTFGPVVLAGLVAGGLSAIAGNSSAASVGDAPDDAATQAALQMVDYPAHQPLVTALALVVLACWGVILVTRGRVRRGVAALGVVAAVGTTVAAVTGLVSEPRHLKDEILALGAAGVDTRPSLWAAAAVLGAVLSAATTALAVVWAPRWPEMGSRYDAPGAAAAPVTTPEDQSSLDLWRAIDEGRDPTAPEPE